MLYKGINITLLFSVRAYEAVAHTYIRAIGRRVADRKPMRQVASVASFFLSCIDVLIDQLLGHRIRPGTPHGNTRICRKFQFWGKIRKSAIGNSTASKLINSRKSKFAPDLLITHAARPGGR
jgi:hypothetical protein